MSRFGNRRKEEGSQGGRVGRGGRLIHRLLVPAIVLFFSAEPTSSQTSSGALTAQKIPVNQYFVSVMETVTVSMQTISPEKPDSPVCLPYNNTLKNCTQSGNVYPLLLDGQRTGSSQSCSFWSETEEYYIWDKDKQPRIILVIPHGWCADYITLACCRNTEQRIYLPLGATVTVYDSLGAVPQMVSSSYNGRTPPLARVDLDRCRMEKYLELQVDNPHSYQKTLMYHFISEVEVYGRQVPTRDARVTRPNNPTLSSNSTHVDTKSNRGEGSDNVTVAVGVVLSVCVLFALVITAVVVAGVAAAQRAKRIQNRQSDSDRTNDTEYASIEPFRQPDIQQNSTSNVIMIANPSYAHTQVASKSTSTGGGRPEPREYETPVSTSTSLQRDRSGYAFVLADEDRCFASHQYQSSSTIGVPHHGEGARDPGYDYVGEVQPRTCPSDCVPSKGQDGHKATAYAISPVKAANEMSQHSPPAPSSPHRHSVYSYI